jgi:hypothetical protein
MKLTHAPSTGTLLPKLKKQLGFTRPVLLTLGAVLLVQAAHGEVTYQYTGNNFTYFVSPYTGDDHISITLRLPAALPAGLNNADITQYAGYSLSISDGHVTLACPGSICLFTQVSTGPSGAITFWNFQVYVAGGHSLGSQSVPGGAADEALINPTPVLGANVGQPGVWVLLPPDPAELTGSLISTVIGMHIQLGTSLTDQLNTVLQDLLTHNGLACPDLNVFISHVQAQTGKKINPAQAATIADQVAKISAAIPCS